tara:strand:+ start:2874 stop:3599 length:726 start_codon:yes stop_codon:yes gene_type:complete
MKYCVDMPGCLGDSIFVQKLIHQLSEESDDVFWHINGGTWNSGACRLISPPNVQKGPHLPRNYPGVDKTYDLCYHGDRFSSDLMKSKYTYNGFDSTGWQKYVKYDRNLEIENQLMTHLGIEKGDPYIFYNDTYGSDSKHNGVVKSIPEGYDGKVIKLEIFNECTVWDWCTVFENAEEIYTVDTSIVWVIETLETKATKMTCHPRHYICVKNQIADLLSKPWIHVDYDRDTWRELCPDEREF